MREYLEHQDNQYQIGISQTTGNIIRLLSDCDRRIFKLASITQQLMPAVRLGQIHFIYNRRHAPLGYVAWAFITEEVLNRLKEGQYDLHFSEWNEGDIVYLFDIVSPYGYAKELLSSFMRTNFSTKKRVFAKKHGKQYFFDRVIKKRYEKI